jgi:hypothetical protein
MSGSYSYIGADGLAYVVDWYADETGFHPTAPHLPKAGRRPVMDNSMFALIFKKSIKQKRVLGLLDPDPDPLVRGMDPDLDPSNIKQK